MGIYLLNSEDRLVWVYYHYKIADRLPSWLQNQWLVISVIDAASYPLGHTLFLYSILKSESNIKGLQYYVIIIFFFLLILCYF